MVGLIAQHIRVQGQAHQDDGRNRKCELSQLLQIERLLKPGECRKLQRQGDGEPSLAEDEGKSETDAGNRCSRIETESEAVRPFLPSLVQGADQRYSDTGSSGCGDCP